MSTEESSLQESSLQDYEALEPWRENYAKPMFPTRASLEWFLRKYRVELVEAGALVLRGGRGVGPLVHKRLMPAEVRRIRYAESMARLNRSVAA